VFITTKPQDAAEIAVPRVAKAKDGDVAAVHELPQRLLGPPVGLDVLERLDAMERQLAGMNGPGHGS
jgi:hypothetical protein